ncbi:MAG: hypothetical protein KDE25_04015 [Novosphingobium sp.]|nr:hypothetical protein [Novosphingobium sp.]
MTYVFCYFLSVLGTHVLLGPLLKLMQTTSGSNVTHPADIRSPRNRWWQNLWVGGTERAIVTTLVIYSPKTIPIFIGGWVAAKLAAGWTRFSGVEYASGNVIGLVGNAFSFAAAIAAGMLIAPDFLGNFNAEEQAICTEK